MQAPLLLLAPPPAAAASCGHAAASWATRAMPLIKEPQPLRWMVAAASLAPYDCQRAPILPILR